MEEGSTKNGRQRSKMTHEAGQVSSRSTARSTGGEGRSTARSTGVHDVHRVSPVDRKQAALGLGPVNRTVDRRHGSVDRQTRFSFPYGIRIPFLFGIESS